MYTVGIDLGTTNSACCTLIDGRYEFITFGHEEVLPSVSLYQGGKSLLDQWQRENQWFMQRIILVHPKRIWEIWEKSWTIDREIFTPTDVATGLLSHIQ